MDRVDVIVVGAGVIGLATARALSLSGRSVVVVERHRHVGSETSSRNSGVIHSGIYYVPGSLKARLCVRGRELLYPYCEARSVPHRRCGKLIVANAAERNKLERLQATAASNGVDNLLWLDSTAIRDREPEVRADAGLWCPDTGIVSVHELMTALHGDVEGAGGSIVLRTEFVGAERRSDGFDVELCCEGEAFVLSCGGLVNSAGLAAVPVLSRLGWYPPERIPGRHFAKGSYFEFSGRSPFRHLVYPMPAEAGLGVHATLDMAGRLRFGPDVEWVNIASGAEPDYTVDPGRCAQFYSAIREYWPGLPDDSLVPSYSGVRPKLAGPGTGFADFRIEGPRQHSVPGFVSLSGMESPGLTASLAIGEEVARMYDEDAL